MSRTNLKGWLFAATSGIALAAGAANAQTDPIPPERYTLDERGVDLISGKWMPVAGGTSIGPADTGLSYSQIQLENGIWWDPAVGGIALCGIGIDCVVTVDGYSEVFSPGVYQSGQVTYAPKENTGSSLVENVSTGQFTYTRSDGTAFVMERKGHHTLPDGVVTRRTAPNGLVTTYAYRTQNATTCNDPDPELEFPGGGQPICITMEFGRLQSYQTNTGYMVHYDYASDTDPTDAGWSSVTKVTALNLAIDYCAPLATSCSYSRTWPSVAFSTASPATGVTDEIFTDQSGFTTRYRTSSYGQQTDVLLGANPNPVTTVERYLNGQVTAVTGASGRWEYAISDAGATRTMVVEGPLDQKLTVVTDLTVGQPSSATLVTSVSPAASQTWSWTYNTGGRVATATSPDGQTATYAYDGRGNVTQTTYAPKPGSGLSNIVTSAAYPATCANPVTCNLPTSTTDARGNVTEYTWDSAHGGLLTVTAPAPTSGAARPQTRISYAPQTAYYKNSSGVIAAAPTSVTLPVSISACASGTSCIGTADEVRTTFAYGSAGVANNLMPTSVSRGSGAAPSMVVTSVTYTAEGDMAVVDGPLTGSGDTTTYRYDGRRRMVGVIGPDPDGAGTGLNRAQRLTYNDWSQVTLAETGTTVGYTDANWANFSPLVRTGTTYDAYGRPVTASQQSATGAIISLQQVSYDAAGRVDCTALRMNTSTYGSLPASACTAAAAGTDGPDRITKYGYDAAGRPTSATSAYGLAEAITESVTYTANGQVASLTDGEGNVSIQEYDGHDRPVRLRYPDPSGTGTSTTDYEEVGYDAAGNVTSQRNRAGQTTTIAYDNLNRPTTVTPPAGTMGVSLTYDNLGRVLTSTGGGQTLTNVWDPLSRLTSETGPLGAMSYQYDAAGAMTRITWPDSFYVQYDRDNYGAVNAIRENGAVSGAGLLAVYYYNNLGQTHMIGRGNGVTTIYGYDAWFRMNSLSHDAAGTANDVAFTYGLNPAGQIASRTVSNPAYVYAPVTGTTSYANDGLNRVTSAAGSAVTYDANQNIASALGTSYSFDAANRLTGTTGTSFTYDPASRLYSNSSAGVRYQYAGQQLVGEYNGTGALVSRHIPGPGLDQTVASISSGTRYQQIADERQSVIGLSNASGGMAGINRYDEYGVPAPGNSDLFQYTGQIRLASSLYHYRARAYAPQLGRFLQTDPIGYASGTNLYGYVSGDPLNLVDPLGLTARAPSGYQDCWVVHAGDGKGNPVGEPTGGGCRAPVFPQSISLTFGDRPEFGGVNGGPGGTPGSGPLQPVTDRCAALATPRRPGRGSNFAFDWQRSAPVVAAKYLQHSAPRLPNGRQQSYFHTGQVSLADVSTMTMYAASASVAVNSYGNARITVDIGRVVGYDYRSGADTSYLTVILSPSRWDPQTRTRTRSVVSVYPGCP